MVSLFVSPVLEPVLDSLQKMKLPLLLTSLAILADSNALLLKEDARPRCIKIDDCSCRLKNVPELGLINLHGLVNDKHEPRYVTEEQSDQTGRMYTFYYNPCMNFLDLGCPNTAVCQKNTNDNQYYYFYDLGNIDTTEFEYQNNSLFAIYKSLAQNKDDVNRTSEIELVCDETEILGRFEFIGEPIQAHYRFKLHTQCACPGRCKSSKIECVGQDLCTCEMSDGTGTINLHSLDNPINPMKDELNLNQTIFYNPCSPVANPDCGNYSVCEMQGGSIVGLGYANTARFVNSQKIGIEYLGNEGSSSTVNLICDYSQRDKPRFRVDKATNTYTVRSVCACPNGCNAPASPLITLSCDQIDSCTCKSNSDNAIINLHDLDNPYAPLTTTDSTDYTYYYNPCSGLKIKVDENGKCDEVASCQFDPYVNNYNNIGQIYPKIDYNATTKEFTFHYTDGEDNRSFDVRMICDPKADNPVLAIDGDIPHGVLSYPLKLTTRLACF